MTRPQALIRRDVFDRVKTHMLGMKRRATDSHGIGRLRCRDGRRCPIGALIPDSAYSPELESRELNDLLQDKLAPPPMPERARLLLALRAGGVRCDQLTVEMLVEIQELHDTADLANWPGGLRAIEEHYFGRAA